MNYREALAWLYATQQFGIKLGLGNIERLLRAVGVFDSRGSRDNGPAARWHSLAGSPTVIHVAGTNGKGSVCAFADSICRAAGFRVGLFTSPHLISFRERIRVNGEMIPQPAVADGLTTIRDCVSGWDPHPTFFEITTALALQHFTTEQCEIIVLETGMGGRLDATNAITSNVAVITRIDFDHEKWLGHSIAEIACEKAGIIKGLIPVVSAPQSHEAETVLERRAHDCEAPLRVVNELWSKTKVGLRGNHQKINASLAVAALNAANIRVSEQAITHGLESVEWPARFQVLHPENASCTSPGSAVNPHDQAQGSAPVIVIDGAHNPGGGRALARTWREEFGDQRATILLAILRDKNAAVLADILRPIAKEFVLPQIRSVRALPPGELAELLAIGTPSLPCSVVASTAKAIEYAHNQPGHVLITGSLHFAGEALAILRGEPEALEDCAQ